MLQAIVAGDVRDEPAEAEVLADHRKLLIQRDLRNSFDRFHHAQAMAATVEMAPRLGRLAAAQWRFGRS
eukprot:10819547-Prorocentrum_lima.AAC.1